MDGSATSYHWQRLAFEVGVGVAADRLVVVGTHVQIRQLPRHLPIPLLLLLFMYFRVHLRGAPDFNIHSIELTKVIRMPGVFGN